MKNKFIETEYMPNGEKRKRLKISDKLVFSYTSTQDDYGWQNAHYHKHAEETYLVLRGEILVVMKKNNIVKFKQLRPGNRITIPAGVKHNVHVGKNTLFYVSKKSKKNLNEDWYSASKLDTYSKEINEIADYKKLSIKISK